eukprot:gene23770-3428_t
MVQADGGGCLVGPKAQNRMGAVTAKQAAIALVVAAAFCCAAVVTLVEHSVYTINSVGSERGAALISQRIRRTTSGDDDGETFVDGDGLAVADSADVPWFRNESQCNISGIDRKDQCVYVTEVSACISGSRIPYLEFPYCSLASAQVGAILLLVCWIGFLFVNLAMVVDIRIVPNLETISKTLGLSDTLAGVTLLALGNGAADIFSALAAVTSSPDGGMLAVAGLCGGGLYVTTVVSGIIAIKFEPEARIQTLGRDCAFYIVSLGWVIFMLHDSMIQLWECVMFL